MGNTPSSSGEFLGSEEAPHGHDLAILEDDAPPLPPPPAPHHAPPAQHQPQRPATRRGGAQGLRQAVWNPFDQPGYREHCPDVDRALAYDPDASSSSATSIEELSMRNEGVLDLEGDALRVQPAPADTRGEAQRQQALAAWFKARADARVSAAQLLHAAARTHSARGTHAAAWRPSTAFLLWVRAQPDSPTPSSPWRPDGLPFVDTPESPTGACGVQRSSASRVASGASQLRGAAHARAL